MGAGWDERPPPVRTASDQIEPYICGTDRLYSLYIITDKGMTRTFGMGLESMILYASLLAGAAGIATVVKSNFLAIVLLLFIVALPFAEHLRLRRVKRLLTRPPAELMAKAPPSNVVPWERIRKITYADGTFRIAEPKFVFKALDSASAEKTLEDIRRMRPGELLQAQTRLRARIAYRFARGPAIFLLLFALTTITLFTASLLPFFPGEQSQYAAVLTSTRTQFAGASPPREFALIFLNNAQVALYNGVPFIGQFGLFLSTYNTGRVIQEIAIQDSVSPLAILSLLYSLPHTWVETLSYPIASGVTLQFILKNVYPELTSPVSERLRNWRSRPDAQLGVTYAGVGGMLLFAGFLEVTEPPLRAGAYALWLPVLGLAIWYLRRRALHAGAPTGVPPS